MSISVIILKYGDHLSPIWNLLADTKSNRIAVNYRKPQYITKIGFYLYLPAPVAIILVHQIQLVSTV